MNESREVQVLRAARALIERGWTTGGFFRDYEGDEIELLDPSSPFNEIADDTPTFRVACCCAAGAILLAGRKLGLSGRQIAPSMAELARTVETKDQRALGCYDACDIVISFNDRVGTRKASVLDAFDATIERISKEDVSA